MAKKETKSKSGTGKKKGSAKKRRATAAEVSGSEAALSVLEGEMKSVIRSAFLNRGH